MRAIAIAAVALVALCALGGMAGAAPEATVKVGDNFLRPGQKTVSKGTKVRFQWVGAARHHIVKSKGPGGPVASPATARRGVNLVKRFEKTGTYRFICTIHPAEMRLKLVVVK
jgi:plastocyanin